YFDENAQKIKFSINDVGSETTILPQYNHLFFNDHPGAVWLTSEEKGFSKLVFSDVAFRHHDLFINEHNSLYNEVRSLLLKSEERRVGKECRARGESEDIREKQIVG